MVQQHIPWSQPSFWGNERQYVVDALDSGWISGGSYVDNLEKRFSEILKKRYVLTTSNGTTAILLSYLCIDVQPGDEIIVPGFAFMAAANMAVHMKARPVFAEVDTRTWCLTASEVEKRMTSKTKAIVPVHTYGNVCDMNEILGLANHEGLVVLEDCAEALFSRYNDQYCGTFGHVNSFSLHATKTITTGEGGLVVTDDERAYRKMLLYRSHGLSRRGTYYHEVPGHNFRLTNIQAALGCAQLEHLEQIVRERRRVHEQYRNCLTEERGVRLQQFDRRVDPVLWALAVKIDPRAFPQGRDAVIGQMKSEGIETRPGFVASSQLTIFDAPDLPVCEDLSRNVICLPTFATMTNEQIQFVCKQFLRLRRS